MRSKCELLKVLSYVHDNDDAVNVLIFISLQSPGRSGLDAQGVMMFRARPSAPTPRSISLVQQSADLINNLSQDLYGRFCWEGEAHLAGQTVNSSLKLTDISQHPAGFHKFAQKCCSL